MAKNMNKQMKKAGIIGGLGPETTTKFYMEIVLSCSKISGIRPKVIISNVAIPLDIEKDIITKSKNKERILPFLLASAIELEKAGADFIVIPCNTVHVFIEEIRKSVKIPVLSIIEETADFLMSQNAKSVGLLGTDVTIKEKLFNKKLNKNGINIIIPNKISQSKLGIIINNLVNNQQSEKDKEGLLKIIDILIIKQVDCVLLACTDLQLLITNHERIKVFDTMDILAKATVREILNCGPRGNRTLIP